MPSKSAPLHWAFSTLLIAAGAAGCGEDDPPRPVFTPVFQEEDCPSQAPGARCGAVEVPERHGQPEGPKIRLFVVHLRSTGAEPAPTPLLMLTGGAGASAISAFRELLTGPAGAAIRARRDVVMYDQRGAGASTPSLTCPELAATVETHFGETLSAAQTRALTTQALQQCHDRWVAAGVDLAAYNSVESAADVAAVMKALGFERYDLYGLSYGTLLAQHVLRDFPQAVRSLALDSTPPVERNILTSAPANADRALRLLFSSCRADAACAAAFPDLESTTLGLIQALDTSPAMIPSKHPKTGAPVSWPLTGQELLGKLLNGFSASTIPYLPLFLGTMAAGDFSLLKDSLPLWAEQDRTYAEAREYTFRCTEAAGFSLEDVSWEGLYPVIKPFFTPVLGDIRDVCAAWGLEPVAASALQPVKSGTPALLMVGQFDITTPPPLAMEVQHNLSHSFLFEFPATGHVVLGECALKLMESFLEDPSARPDEACVKDLKLSFVTP